MAKRLDIVERLRAVKPSLGYFPKCRDAANEIERLRLWIKNDALRTNTCTFNVLGDICENCGCGKRDHSNAALTGAEGVRVEGTVMQQTET